MPDSPHADIELLRSHSLTTLVQRELVRRILAGELNPGAKLSEAEDRWLKFQEEYGEA